MEVGEIYLWDSVSNHHLRKHHGEFCLYMGEDRIEREDGITIVNHKVMMIGTGIVQTLDKSCLKYLYRQYN